MKTFNLMGLFLLTGAFGGLIALTLTGGVPPQEGIMWGIGILAVICLKLKSVV